MENNSKLSKTIIYLHYKIYMIDYKIRILLYKLKFEFSSALKVTKKKNIIIIKEI